MSLQQFCDDLNSGSPQNSYHKVTANYSFPCGEASLEGEDYPFATAVSYTHLDVYKRQEYGKAGLFYWEKVTGGSAQGQGYKIYMVGRKNGEGGEYEAVYHNTTSTAHNTGGIVKEYGYGYYVAKKGGGTETYALDVSWLNVNVSATNPVTTNASADSYFNENYPGYKFYCYTTCDETNLATSYKTNGVDANGRPVSYTHLDVYKRQPKGLHTVRFQHP